MSKLAITGIVIAALAAGAVAPVAASSTPMRPSSHSIAIVSGTVDPWQQNLNAQAKYSQVSDPWALNLFARQSYRDRGQTTVGPLSTVSAVSTGGFDWADAGIGAAFAFGITLLGAASLVTIRRHHGPFAH